MCSDSCFARQNIRQNYCVSVGSLFFTMFSWRNFFGVKEITLEMETLFVKASTIQSAEYEYLQPDVKYANTDVAPSPIMENNRVRN